MRILLIHTGGTIGMAATEAGFAPKAGVVEAAVASMVADGRVTALVELVTMDPMIDSSEATPKDWAAIAAQVFDAEGKYDAVVVTHGTDTLAFSAAALCLSLPGVTLPVIVTGSMVPLTVPDSDGWGNLADALRAAEHAEPGIWVQFAGQLLHGGRVRKAHSTAPNAFCAASSDVAPRIAAAAPMLQRVDQSNVAVLTVTPGGSSALMDYGCSQCDGIVLRVYGSGTAPDTAALRRALATAQSRKIPVIAISQCPEGGMRFGTYASGQILPDCDVIDGRDTTLEMAYVKMQFALSLHRGFPAQRAYLERALCGERGM
ncbi:asparaginase [Phaeobacter sp. J2-8]|uniref:asparaginase n=1 Tax=Phaeobacter sp. J2-8 TaxID=2931394 RepID=UPI001FD22C22|nr:asparaginase [Phaeobacter sp. J2-8]MCJ7874862.1 asparaginase [Phaeobacter sp. J2-8]